MPGGARLDLNAHRSTRHPPPTRTITAAGSSLSETPSHKRTTGGREGRRRSGRGWPSRLPRRTMAGAADWSTFTLHPDVPDFPPHTDEAAGKWAGGHGRPWPLGQGMQVRSFSGVVPPGVGNGRERPQGPAHVQAGPDRASVSTPSRSQVHGPPDPSSVIRIAQPVALGPRSRAPAGVSVLYCGSYRLVRRQAQAAEGVGSTGFRALPRERFR